MTAQLFLILAIILCAVSGLLTEAIKTATKQKWSANLIALIDSIIVGVGGTSITYVWLNIPFTLSNILAIVCMAVAIWMGSMLGYDKVIQLIRQIIEGKKDE